MLLIANDLSMCLLNLVGVRRTTTIYLG